MTLHFSHRQIVCPGDLLAEGDYACGRNVFRVGDRIYSQVLGLAESRKEDGKEVISVIALRGFYFPSKGDKVIGVVTDRSRNKWLVDINAPYVAVLPEEKGEEKEEIRIGDVVVAEIREFVPGSRPVLSLIRDRKTGRKILKKGRLVQMSAAKLPRLVGHRGSMISVIEEKSGCKVVHGSNGYVYIEGDRKAEEVVIEAIRIIEREAHTSGLTDRIAAFIEGRLREGKEAHS